ncbi:dienelactone hydrolase family protein [Neobacillus niacini]|uniref:dienelactone hydrolase family protein n=1 Tax=Neobacillus niacini TaxID=86668 RepID=UPI002FFD67A8
MYKLETLEKVGIPPLLNNLHTIEEWKEKRTRILEQWKECLGGFSSLVESRLKIVSWTVQEDHFRIKVRYSTFLDDWVSAYVLLPRNEQKAEVVTEKDVLELLYTDKSDRQSLFPAVLALHPTSENGKDNISLSFGRKNRQYAYELVKRGYVVLAPDTITAGERLLPGDKPFYTKAFYERHPEWSAVGKMMTDHQQGIGLLSHFSSVNHEKIGVIGHSLGGYNSYFLAGIDQRIKAVVCSCGFATFAQDPERHRWGRREWFSHFPKISDFIDNGKVPFEFNEIAALAAPVPFFISMAQNDQIFPHWKPSAECLADLNLLYDWMGEGDKFTSLIGNFGHDFPVEVRTMAYAFLDRWLK